MNSYEINVFISTISLYLYKTLQHTRKVEHCKFVLLLNEAIGKQVPLFIGHTTCILVKWWGTNGAKCNY